MGCVVNILLIQLINSLQHKFHFVEWNNAIVLKNENDKMTWIEMDKSYNSVVKNVGDVSLAKKFEDNQHILGLRPRLAI